MVSPFLSPGLVTRDNQLASLHLKRDLSLPTLLSTVVTSEEDAGYAEGTVTNTRFGSFPHSTIIGLPWGSQVRASQVDTGTRGRKEQHAGKKRKADAISNGVKDQSPAPPLKEAVTASSGFLHVLPPTPENWTTSLPHRTQVVYTPDYSYILHRIRARPGSVLIEAGSGSGSFTHAAARAVFNGDPSQSTTVEAATSQRSHRYGRVFTYEFHLERHRKVAQEMKEHRLDSLVLATHRDVYNDGFLVQTPDPDTKSSPSATAIFLDLPAPWLALPHLTRNPSNSHPSALDPSSSIHICTFSPCIEQAQKTVSALRRLGWLDIEMVEMQHKRIEVRREYTGLQYDGMRGVNAVAANVDEALTKLREVERRARDFHASSDSRTADDKKPGIPAIATQPQEASKTLFKGGRVIHRNEPELKTHTSYLVFAVLPREWSDDDEMAARTASSTVVSAPSTGPKSQRQLKREAKQRSRGRREARQEAENGARSAA